MLPYLGWVVAALLLGYLLGSRFPERTGLRKRCRRIVVYRGRSSREITELLGSPAQDVMRLEDGRTLRTWREGSYAITLCFDAQDVCLGVHDEQG